MDIVLRYFVVIAVAMSAFNWLVAERKLAADVGATPGQLSLARRFTRVLYGSMIVSFLALGGLQWAGGYADPLFPFYDRTTTVWSTAAWVIFAILWLIHIVGIWRPGVAEAALQLGLVRSPSASPRAFRLIMTFALLINVGVFAALLAGAWGPIPRPTF